LFGKVNKSSQWHPKSHSFPSIQRDVSKTTTSWVHKITFNFRHCWRSLILEMFKSLRKIYIFCWAHCPLKALSLRPHRTCPNCLECTKARDHSDKLTPNNCPSILKSTSLSYWKGWSNKVCPQGFHKIPGNSLLARMDRVPQAKIPCSQRIEQNYIKWCINSFGVGLRKDNYKACLVGEVFPCPMQVLVSKYVQKDCNLGLV
jgi:hypothetical protein